jgi:hypothetical protein
MNSITRPGLMLLVVSMSLTLLPHHSVSNCQDVLPNPTLVFIGREPYETGGKSFTRYKYAVENQSAV